MKDQEEVGRGYCRIVEMGGRGRLDGGNDWVCQSEVGWELYPL